MLFINSANIEAAVAVLELETLSRPAYLRALRKLHMQGIARMEEILWRRARIVLCTPVYLQAVSAKLPAGASVCGLHDEVGTAADWEMARWAAFPQLDALFWLGDKHRVQACRCSRKLLDNASSWAHPVPLRPHHCAYVGRLLSSWLGVVRP